MSGWDGKQYRMKRWDCYVLNLSFNPFPLVWVCLDASAVPCAFYFLFPVYCVSAGVRREFLVNRVRPILFALWEITSDRTGHVMIYHPGC